MLVTVRLLLGCVLLVAGVSKVRSASARRDFAASIRDLGLARGRTATVLGTGVAMAEVGVAALLVIPAPDGARHGIGPAAAAVLLSAFTAVVWRALRRGAPASCRCFGSGGGAFRRDHLWRNILLCLLAVGALAAELAPATPPVTLDGWLCAAFAAVVGAGLALPVIHWDDARLLAGRA
ncbi:MauE/DoxX family redox-associated membrane protein [Sphaerisporangium krabiense]|uniref:Putative membrane protein YphA (DoxX/SURF4 family) n=1 Tax=Sphaerisporangium krabiense TaxID=763782 RepID=A0A7W8YZG5_9ACTN|nr:MauE/DoxX family redox-associated membrane protein [Sphaerisporangium krabiense]MBB5624596.1 putative membrane protein YphA (DoxX/SURF4 family) [Sphaerisporangium krabiense]